jgi:flagellar biosynthesis/type III secretory pathway protein FliH
MAAQRLGGAISFDLADFKTEAARILAEARAEAEELVRDAKAESARIRTEAADKGRVEGMALSHDAGFAAGKAEGESMGLALVQSEYSARLADLAANWSESLIHWEVSREALLREARRGLLRLALGIASRVIQRVVDADPDVALGQLESALELLGTATAVTVSCSAGDRALLEANLPLVLERLGSTRDVTFVTDPAMSKGGVVVRVAEGGIDATIGTQLDRIAEALLPGSGGRNVIP